MGEGKLPVRYLGVPLISSRLCASDCDTLLEKIIARINSWLSRNLSFAGRKNIYLWFDAWHPDEVLYEKYGYRVIYDAHSKLEARLDSVIQSGQWYWPAARSAHLDNIQSRLCMVPIGDEDKAKWNVSKTVCASTIYNIWRNRNALRHNNNPCIEEKLIQRIKWEVRIRFATKGVFGFSYLL
ncbi:hypothetical protein Dsin_001193 [Dipteronia sinensis]|uniref:Reverse transcriptase n=1 Tax=Dipteronia sinensis TaxID=43782 RepID=A0AAE0EIS2_9ROSI|nr:hypothetical protein Dsin_001193 [Dipteronia sinensis]